MAFNINKRILDKMEKRCDNDEVMLDYIRYIIAYELSGSKQYTKEYDKALKQYAKRYEEVSL